MGKPGGDLLGDVDELRLGVVGGGEAAGDGLDGVVGDSVRDGVWRAAADLAGDGAPDEVQMSSSPRS